MVIDIEEFEAAVKTAGGVTAAAAELGVDPGTIKRWLKGLNRITGTRERTIEDFISKHPSDPRQRPLRHYSDDELIREIHHRLSLEDRSNDQRRTKRSPRVSGSASATPKGTKAGRSRLDGVRGDAVDRGIHAERPEGPAEGF